MLAPGKSPVEGRRHFKVILDCAPFPVVRGSGVSLRKEIRLLGSPKQQKHSMGKPYSGDDYVAEGRAGRPQVWRTHLEVISNTCG